MELDQLTEKLDHEFDIINNKEDLVEWAVTNDNKEFIQKDFLEHKTGLMNINSRDIKKVYTVVFVTDNIIKKISKEKNCLILTHHQFNYFEGKRGLLPIRSEIFKILKETGNSIYVAHAQLDTHKKYGTSVTLAELCKIKTDTLFFDYFGAPTALTGKVNKIDFQQFCENVKRNIKRSYLTLYKNRDFVEKIAVIAGGGDIPEILQKAYDFGCDTLLTGTIEHRWLAPFVQEGNKKFHELNKELKLNLIGGTHYATERPAMIKLTGLIRSYGVECEYCEDEVLLNAE